MFAAGKTAAVSGAGPDDKFNYVTMLLHGDGTNGAQNNTFLDSSSNAFSITRNGNTTQGSFSPYGSNWSNYFDGSSYLTTSSTQIIPTGSFTVECYVFVTGSGNNQKFVSQGSSGSAGRFSLGIEGGNWFVQLGGDLIQTGTPVKNQWNYVATTYNGSTITMYVNGSSIGTVSSTANAQNAALTIGQDWNAYLTTGYISNVRVSNTVRTITTPTASYTSDANTRLLACQANRFLDSSSNGFAFTVTGTPSVQRFNPFGASTAYSTSVIGGSGYFDGSGDDLTLTMTGGVGSGDFTIEYWLYPTSLYNYITVFGTTRSTTGLSVGTQAAGQIVLYVDGSGEVLRGTTAMKVNTWNHCAFTRSGTTMRGYLNGVLDATGTSSNNFSQTAAAIGSLDHSGEYATGYISNLRVVSGTALYTGSTLTVPTAPLTAVSNTRLLTNMTNGAIYDNAMMNDLETVGNAQISTSVVKYGTGSLAFDGNNDWLSIRSSPNLAFGSGDFTIECWVYANSLDSYNAVFAQWPDNGGSTNNSYVLETVGSDMNFYYCSGTTVYSGTTLGTITTGVWIHYAICRSGNTLYPFKNGVLNTTTSITQTLNSPTSAVTIGGQVAGGGSWNGYIDDLRITKGYARYTASFTPPTAAFSNTGPI